MHTTQQKAYIFLWILLGVTGLWLGFPNTLPQFPVLVLFYPASLCYLGLHVSHKWAAFRAGWCVGLLGSSAVLYWLALPVHNVGGLPWLLAAPCAMAIGAYVGIYGGIFCLCVYYLRKYSPVLFGISLGLCWYLLEVLRGTLFTGFPWLSLSTAFAPWPSMLQGASLIGGYALSGLLAGAMCVCMRSFYHTREWRPQIASLCLGICLLGLPLIYGHTRLAANPVNNTPHAQDFSVILVEGNIDQNQKWEPRLQQSTVNTYMRLSQDALAALAAITSPSHTTPALIIWPETSMPFYVQTHPVYAPHIMQFVQESQTPLLLGAPGFTRRDKNLTELYNRAYLFVPQGKKDIFYDKMRLVPFGEYLPPWLAFDFLKPLLQGIGDFTPGRAYAPLQLNTLALGILICYEGIFPEIAHQRIRDGANILVNISNDGWFGKSAAPEQHLQLAILRAVEQGRWLIRGTNTGISCIIDNFGRTRLRGGQFQAQYLIGTARTHAEKTLYFYLAPWLPPLALLCLGAIFMWGRHKKYTF